MLASTNPTRQNDLNDNKEKSIISDMDKIISLEAHLTASEIRLEGEICENNRLRNYIELLESDIEDKKKTEKRQKSEIRRLMNDNDNLRKSLSRFNGLKKYTSVFKAVNTDISSVKSPVPVLRPDQNDLPHQKLNDFRDKMVDIVSAMVGVIEESNLKCNSDGSNPIRASPHRPDNTAAQREPRRVERPSNRRAPPSPEQPSGQRIPVITGVVGSRSTRSCHTQSETNGVTARDQSRSAGKNDCVIIGSSLVAGLGAKLCQEGVDATSYTHRGATIPQIRYRINRILPQNSRPKSVVLLCGGNDCERNQVSSVTDQYDRLINDVKYRCPGVPIILCKVPPRPGGTNIDRNIRDLNKYLVYKAKYDDVITVVDASPCSLSYYRTDQLHFNGKGLKFVAGKLADHVRTNFTDPSHVNHV